MEHAVDSGDIFDQEKVRKKLEHIEKSKKYFFNKSELAGDIEIRDTRDNRNGGQERNGLEVRYACDDVGSTFRRSLGLQQEEECG